MSVDKTVEECYEAPSPDKQNREISPEPLVPRCAHCHSPFDAKTRATKAFIARVIRKGKELEIRVKISTALKKLYSWKFKTNYEFNLPIQFCDLCGLAIARLYGAWELYDQLAASDSYLTQLLKAVSHADVNTGSETLVNQPFELDPEFHSPQHEDVMDSSENANEGPGIDQQVIDDAEEAENQVIKDNLCYICAKSFDKPTNLRRHLLLTHEIGDRQRSFVCPICGKGFHFAYILKKHMVYHSNDKTISCPLEGCKQKFKHKNCLDHHLRLFHSNQRPFVCRYCPKSFKIKRDKFNHETYVHKTPKGVKFACSHGCGLSYKRKSTMVTHANRDCTKRPYNESDEEQEETNAAGEKQNPNERPLRYIFCETCGKVYKSKASLKEHYRRGRCKLRKQKPAALTEAENNQDEQDTLPLIKEASEIDPQVGIIDNMYNT